MSDAPHEAAQKAIKDGQEFDAEHGHEFDALLNSIQANREAKNPDSNKLAKASPVHDITTNSVTKSNALTRAYYRYGLIEKRVMELLISQINPLRTDNQFQNIELTAIEYSETFNIGNKNAYTHLAKAVSSLMRTVITIPEGDDLIEMTLMARAYYKKNQGKIICTFNPLIVPHLAGMRSHFTKYQLSAAINFQSGYTWRLYELLMSWNHGKRDQLKGQVSITVDELRGVLGVPESYKWDSFNKQVLLTAQKELKQKAGIGIKVERKKTGRRITHLKVTFTGEPL